MKMQIETKFTPGDKILHEGRIGHITETNIVAYLCPATGSLETDIEYKYWAVNDAVGGHADYTANERQVLSAHPTDIKKREEELAAMTLPF